jgi:phosphate:Na+ symporter
MILTLLGGVGIFLIGMILLSEGLKGAAGGALRSILQRFSRTPARALLSGAVFTAVVQSSSATTLTTIGFVSAGLLTFPQAVGLIFGANLGTTSTGWLVSILGFKVDFGAVALPLVGLGAFLRLMGSGRTSHLGTALAGFGFIFVGIDILQDGMSGLAGAVDPGRLPGASLPGRVMLVVVGGVMTVLLQSSSAAVATTLAALHVQGITVEQAAFLVIGQNMGTSVKAILAALGGSVPVRRTAVAHTLFNGVTALTALLLFPLLLRVSLALAGPEDPTVAIAIFHSGFNLLGVAILLPILPTFSQWVERLVPEPIPSLTRHLDPSAAEVPEVGVEAARKSALAVAGALVQGLRFRLEGATDPTSELRPGEEGPAEEILPALGDLRSFLAQIRSGPRDEDLFQRHLSVVHAVDHLERLEELRREFPDLGRLPSEIAPMAWRLHQILRVWSEGLEDEQRGRESEAQDGSALEARLLERISIIQTASHAMAEERKDRRHHLLQSMALGETPPNQGQLAILHAKRLDRIGYHAWRGAAHLLPSGTLPQGESGPLQPSPTTGEAPAPATISPSSTKT